MASLALMVSIIFLSVVISGPVSLVFRFLGMPFTAAVLALFSLASGAYWCCVAPFPISILGALSALCGAITLSKI